MGSMAAMIYATAVCLMDLFSNICMQPSRMIVGDMVNNKQKNFAWSWQQSLFQWWRNFSNDLTILSLRCLGCQILLNEELCQTLLSGHIFVQRRFFYLRIMDGL